MRLPFIHGIVMARNEWPLLEVVITHALVHHVDRVHVLDHASTDGTAAGLARLRREWGDRLHVVHLGECPYLQEAATTVMRTIVAAAPDDWLHVFDADEFAIASPGVGLRDVLVDVDPRHPVVRYDVQNWVAPADFSAADLDRYAALRHRSQPTVFLPVPAETLVDEIVAGSINYFDVPFASKIIVRGAATGWTAAGSHRLAGVAAPAETRLPPDVFRVAHFPLLDRRRLDARVAQGRAYLDNGFDPSHGWQSQMLVRLTEHAMLDDFWERHSMPSDRHETGAGGPIVVADDTLAPLVARTLDRVRAARRGAAFGHDPVAADPVAADADVVVPAALRTIREVQAIADDLRRQLDAVLEHERRHMPAAPRRRRGWRRRLSSLFTRRTPDEAPQPAGTAATEPPAHPHVISLGVASRPRRQPPRAAA